MPKQSKYNSTENLKITYFLGAGASFNAIPIWKGQGKSMIDVAISLMDLTYYNPRKEFREKHPVLFRNELLNEFLNKLKRFGELAEFYGSIDIYARRLYLINNLNELNELKHCLSVYFDIWENFLFENFHLPQSNGMSFESVSYQKIDKRYLSLLSVILEQTEKNPRIHDNISFITWNYDLQLEMAYESFLSYNVNSLMQINEDLGFMDGENTQKRRVFHLNGHRGIFKEGDKYYETVERDKSDSIEDYLTRFIDNFSQFKSQDYSSIKYGWESNSEISEDIVSLLNETNVLVIIGYSFPAFNRSIDTKLINYFESKKGYKRVIYQDPFANQDIVNSIFTDPDIVELQRENISQFYIPHEFLSPSPGAEVIF